MKTKENSEDYNEKVNFSWIKVVLIVLICVVVDILLHNLPIKKTVSNFEFSNIVEIIGFPVVAAIFLIISFGLLAVFFIKNQSHMYGTRSIKGFTFGVAMSIIWMVGILETSPITGSSLIDEVFPALADGIPIIMMGLLLGRFIGNDNNLQENQISKIKKIQQLAILTIFFVAGRYLAYEVLGITSGYLVRPVETFVWTFSMGICMGVAYLLLAQNSKNKSSIRHSLWYGVCLIGINWLVFNLFIPLLFNLSLSDFLIRCSVDVVFLTMCIYIANYSRAKILIKSENV